LLGSEKPLLVFQYSPYFKASAPCLYFVTFVIHIGVWSSWPMFRLLLSFFTSLLAFILFFSNPQALAQQVVVQVMSVSNPDSAANEVSRLLNQGVPSFQRAEDVPGSGLRYRVYLGPFDSKDEAVGAAEALKSAGLVGDYLIRADSEVPPAAAAPAIAAAAAPQPAGGDYWPPPSNNAAPAAPQPANGDYWPPPPNNAAPAAPQPNNGDYWPPPPNNAAPAAPQSSSGEYWPPLPQQPQGGAPVQPTVDPAAAGVPSSTPVLAPQGPAAVPANNVPPAAAAAPAAVIPAKPSGAMKVQGFEILADLSSSMRRLSPCVGGLVKQEAVNTLLRKMNHRIPSQPYVAVLRVFGYKQAWSRKDYTTLYFGPATYDREQLESGIGRLFAADSISPFGWALAESENELQAMNNPRAILMFADFEETTDSGAPVEKAKNIVRKYGNDTRIYTYYVTRQTTARELARNIAKAGNGKAYNVCDLLGDEAAFEAMMEEIFGPRDIPPCSDKDSDGVCDDKDLCPSTPIGAPVDERGCWIAAYSQFFDFDKSDVKAAFHPRIKYAAELMVKNPQMGVVTIAGHTDAKGTDAYNMELGRKRAEAVKELLVKFGAPADKLVVESFGKTRPIADNDTEEGRAKNRRVEFHVGDVPK
jgi:OOP family OmpA-OmpF porin